MRSQAECFFLISLLIVYKLTVIRDKADSTSEYSPTDKMVSDNVICVGLSYILHMRCNIRATTRSAREVGSLFSILEWLDKITMGPGKHMFLTRSRPVVL